MTNTNQILKNYLTEHGYKTAKAPELDWWMIYRAEGPIAGFNCIGEYRVNEDTQMIKLCHSNGSKSINLKDPELFQRLDEFLIEAAADPSLYDKW